jgi:hypothetical protein
MSKELKHITYGIVIILVILAITGLVADIPRLKLIGVGGLSIYVCMLLFIHSLIHHFRPRKERGDG